MADYLIDGQHLTNIADDMRAMIGVENSFKFTPEGMHYYLFELAEAIAEEHETINELLEKLNLEINTNAPNGFNNSYNLKNYILENVQNPTLNFNNSNGLITATGNGQTLTQQLNTAPGKTITPNTSQQTAIASNTYATGTINVAGDTNLVPANIMPNKTIFGVTGDSWAGSLTFSGTYATSTYYTASGSFLTVDKGTGRAFITIQGGTSTTWENLYFTTASLPSGVTMLTPPGGTNGYNFGTSGSTKCYFTAVLTGVTGKINVAVTMNTRAGTSYDAVQCALTVTYA